MPSKTISLTERAYERLAREKRKGESFTDVVLRLTRTEGRSLSDLAGLLDPEAADALAGAIEANRAERLRRRQRRLGEDA